jgi:uncharacterized phage infection (PIP) family protein YhgE
MSTVHSKRYWLGLKQSLLAAAFIFALAAVSFGQSSAQEKGLPNPSESPINPGKKDSDIRFGSPLDEMHSKAILKEEKRRYEENLGRAREVSDLASQLAESFESRQAFNSDDSKRLEKLEKLTKRIRNEAGGSDSTSETELKDICTTMVETMKHLAEMAEDLRKMVDKTPRQVISAAVIDQANRVLGVMQHLRSSR